MPIITRMIEAPEPAVEEIVLLARQPIFDTSDKVHGYELLFRRADGSGWPIDDEAKATAHVVVAAFADLSLASVTAGAKAWINVPRQFLLETDISVLPKQRVVLELLERDDFDAVSLARVTALAREGYQLALDDFEWRDELAPFVELASYVKLDMQALGLAGMAQHVRRLTAYDVDVVAEKVETAAERDACHALGVGLYQGYFFERPRLMRGRPTSHQGVARLHTGTSAALASFEEMEDMLRSDPALTLRLLRYINSAGVSVRHRVGSLRQALMLVGANTVRQWLMLVLLSAAGSPRPALLTSALVRARLCESLAREARQSPDSAFLVGLLSICDALFDTSLDEIIGPLPLTPPVRDALIDGTGPLGGLLRQAIALQRGEASAGASASALFGAVQWADAQLEVLTADAA